MLIVHIAKDGVYVDGVSQSEMKHGYKPTISPSWGRTIAYWVVALILSWVAITAMALGLGWRP